MAFTKTYLPVYFVILKNVRDRLKKKIFCKSLK